MSRVLISPIWEYTSTRYIIHNFSISKAFFLVDKEEKEKQTEAVRKLKELYSGLVEIKIKKVDLYNIPNIANDVIDIIDSVGADSEIYVDITSSKRPQCLGVMFGAFKRHKKIEAILYHISDEEGIIELPKLSFYVNESQRELLRIINNKNYSNMQELSTMTSKSRPFLYKNLKELEDRGFITNGDKYKITEAGKLAMLG